jgi:hypothetical protein
MNPMSNNIGAYITSELALDNTTVGAGVGGSGTPVNGNDFDRLASRNLHLSGKLQIGYKATLASGHSATVAWAIRDSEDDVTYTNVEQSTPAEHPSSGSSTITANNDGSAVRGVIEVDVDLMGAKQYLRPVITPTLSHSGVDTLQLSGMWALGGSEILPAASDS